VVIKTLVDVINIKINLSKRLGREKIPMGKAGKKAALNVSCKTIKRRLNLEGYHQYRASKKPFINLETQHAQKVYAISFA
jgi:hypothetical protein